MITSIECYYVHSSETFHTFHRMFYSMPHIIFEYSLDFSRTFPGMFGDIPRNIWRHSPECLVTFPGMFSDIFRNVWRHSPEYSIPPIPRFPRIPFPVPVFLVLYIAAAKTCLYELKISENIEIGHFFQSRTFFHLSSNLHTSCLSAFKCSNLKI